MSGNPLIIGFDPGNSETTVYAASTMANGQRHLTIPSALGSGSLEELERVRSGTGKKAALERDELVLEYGGQTAFVGRLAEEQCLDVTTARGDVHRYHSGHTLRLLLATVGALCYDPEPTIRVVTGVPVQAWTKENRQKVQESLGGSHTFRLNGVERTVHVEAVMVLMEGTGALAVHGLAENVPQAVVDTGGRTTDLVYVENMKPIIPRCSGRPLGVESAADLVQSAFLARYERELTPRELRSVFHAYANGENLPSVFVDGQRVQFNGEVKEAVHAVGANIVSFVSQVWRSSEQGKVASEAAKVCYIGGGAHYFAPQLREVIRHLEVPPAPELANAEGYLSIGRSLNESAWEAFRVREAVA